jgi:ribulose-5-phosphate 4-epimerase/fuculose-1-phosphate aldolase
MRFDDAEYRLRCELACAYRLFDQLGWHELIYNHITVRLPGHENNFLINPFGLMYREITAGNLVRIDIDGNVVGQADHPVNPAGFIVHSAIHAARDDAHCVMHTHTTAGMAVACQAEGLLPLSFPAMFYTGRVAYHDFEGITLDRDERARLAADLGDRNVMILRNHGLLACGPSVGHAFAELYHLQRACEVQIAAQSSGARLTLPEPAIAQRAADQFTATARKGAQNDMLFAAMMRWMDDKDPGYRHA